MSWTLIIEAISVVFGVLFLVLLMREKRWCWFFGIVSSALSILLFLHARLYSEAILYFFYVLIGIYGWWIWGNNNAEQELPIKRWSWVNHLWAIAAGIGGAFALGYTFFKYTYADHPFLDAHTTVFSFIASYLQAHKILSNWIYWIIIDAVTAGLYFSKNFYLYTGLMILYLVLAIIGYLNWQQKMKKINTD